MNIALVLARRVHRVYLPKSALGWILLIVGVAIAVASESLYKKATDENTAKIIRIVGKVVGIAIAACAIFADNL
ncbi:MAG: hypothetical protein NC340_07920 [Ruminococcus flavefaciens]|nr:hypothetical protein [Ruminococcus flavefaciens]MCM1228659.1 hypothetical protein [Ruminococcus flavefaciens]